MFRPSSCVFVAITFVSIVIGFSSGLSVETSAINADAVQLESVELVNVVTQNTSTSDARLDGSESPDDRETTEPIVKYDGAQLWRIQITADSDRIAKSAVSELEDKYGGQRWKTLDDQVDVLLRSQTIDDARQVLVKSNISYDVLIEDLQRAIEAENPPKEEIELLQNRKGHRMTWKAYHRYDNIDSYLNYLAKTYPTLCSVETIGYSAKRRQLRVLKIAEGDPNRAIWIDGGIHAREWISPASVTYIINHLVENWEELPPHFRSVAWYIIPVVNPDGYEYTHTVDRMWRKNRSGGGSGNCVGTDLNRNFGYKWGGEGSSRNPCVETYGGSKAFSEPESIAVRNYLFRIPNLKAYLTFHSYGQYILYPWGYNRSVPPDYKELERVAKEGAQRIQSSNGAQYSVGSSGALLYPAAGGSDDWAKAALGVKYSYTVELRDTGRYGFVLPSGFIESASKDALLFVDTIAKAVNTL